MVSVIIPTYNRSDRIEKSIKSVLAQTYNDFEIIVVDDGSTDNTKDVVTSIDDRRIRYIYQKNAGACVARNLGIETARGEYIAFQDSDDLWVKTKLEKQIAVLEKEKRADIVTCRTILKQLDGSTIITSKDKPEGIIESPYNPIGFSTQTLIMRREVVEKVSFDPNVTRYQDLDFLLSATREGFLIYCIDECLVERVNYSDSITNNPYRVYEMAKYFETKYSDIFIQKNSYLAKFFSSVLLESAYVLKKDQKEYKQLNRKAFKLDGSLKTYIKYLMLNAGLFNAYKKIINKK